jgi:hypothetical protein
MLLASTPGAACPCLLAGVLGLLGVSAPATAQAPEPSRWPEALIAGTDTMDTYARHGAGTPLRRGATYLQRVSRDDGGAWVLQREWLDSLGTARTVQRIRTHTQSLATRHHCVRAPADSASFLASDGRAVGWVVPQGAPAFFFDGEAPDRIAPDVAELGFAASQPTPGEVLIYPTYALYGGDPLATTADTLRVVGQGTVRDGAREIPCLLVERAGGTRLWVEARTGQVLARRGAAGGGQVTWWHVRRGTLPPDTDEAP